MSNRGLTLIEMMVVIGIIGVLSSVVLVNLNKARLKATDARIKIELSSIRRSAELYYNGAGNLTYGSNTNSCNTGSSMFRQDVNIRNLITSIRSTPGVNTTCRSTGSNFAVSANLISIVGSFGDNWCIDSSGASRFTDDPPATNVPFCP